MHRRRPVLLAGTYARWAAGGCSWPPIWCRCCWRAGCCPLSGLFTGTATAAVIEAAPPNWQNPSSHGGYDRQYGRAEQWADSAGVLVQYAPEPLWLSFLVHIVLVILAAGVVLLVPETRAARGESGSRCRCPTRSARYSSSLRWQPSPASPSPACSPPWRRPSSPPSSGSPIMRWPDCWPARSSRPRRWRRSCGRYPARTGRGVGRAARRRNGRPRRGAAIFLPGRTGRRLGDLRRRAGHQFQPGTRRGRRENPADFRAEVGSAYFLVSYIAISVPVIGVGVAAQLGPAHRRNPVRGGRGGARGRVSGRDPAAGDRRQPGLGSRRWLSGFRAAVRACPLRSAMGNRPRPCPRNERPNR